MPKVTGNRKGASTVDVTPLPLSWEQKTIRVLTDKRTHGMDVEDAYCYGPLAVHAMVSDPARFAITHIGSGFLATAVGELDDAIKIAEILVQNLICRTVLIQGTDPKKIPPALPDWVGPWLIECNKQNKYISPRKGKS